MGAVEFLFPKGIDLLWREDFPQPALKHAQIGDRPVCLLHLAATRKRGASTPRCTSECPCSWASRIASRLRDPSTAFAGALEAAAGRGGSWEERRAGPRQHRSGVPRMPANARKIRSNVDRHG